MNDETNYLNNVISRPILLLLISFIAGIILCDQTGCFFNNSYIAFTAVIITACLILILRKIFIGESTLCIPLFLFVTLGYISFYISAGFDISQNHISHYAGSKKYQITGVVETKPFSNNRWSQFYLSVKSLSYKDNKIKSVSGKIKIYVRGNNLKLIQGDKILFRAKIKPIRSFANPGGFDYKRYMRFQGVYGSSYVDYKKIKLLESAWKTPSFFLVKLQQLREQFASFVKTHSSSKDTTDVLNALIIGKKYQLSAKCKESFRRAGVGHLLAISGLHTGVVATVSFFLFYNLLLYIKPLLWSATTGKVAAILTIFPVFIYGVIAGFSPSVQRACIMVAVFLMASCLERENDTLNTLSIAAMLILVFSPMSLFSISFQLSFSAVFSIVIGLDITFKNSNQNNRFYDKIFLYLKGSLLVSVFAIVGTIPLAMHYFNQVSLIGIVANFLVVPIVCLLVVPIGLFSMVTINILPVFSIIAIKISDFLLVGVIKTVFFFSNLSFAAVTTITPTIFEICCYYSFFILIIIFIQSKKNTTLLSGKKKLYITLMVTVLIMIFADICYWFNDRFWHKELRITAIDVGQGSSTLIEIPGGYRILVDGGGFSDNTIFDIGQRVVAPFLWNKKIKTIDLVILTHPEADHLNGLTYILKNFNVKKFWSNNQRSKTNSYEKLIHAVQENNIINEKFSSLSRILKIGQVEIKILYPPANFLENSKIKKLSDFNNNSLVIRVQMGVVSVLLPGDIMKKSEKILLDMAGNKVGSTILFSPHHGSKTSSSKKFLNMVKPSVIVISVGWKNRFRMPHKIVLKRYKELSCKVFRTDLHGAVTVSTDGKKFNIVSTRKSVNKE